MFCEIHNAEGDSGGTLSQIVAVVIITTPPQATHYLPSTKKAPKLHKGEMMYVADHMAHEGPALPSRNSRKLGLFDS